MITGPLTGVLLDSSPLWLEAVDHVAAGIGVRVVGRTTRPDMALSLLLQHRPQLFVAGLDGEPDPVAGLAFLRDALKAVPGMKVIVVSSDADTGLIEAALETGVAAYVLRTAQPEDLASAIYQSFEHSVYLPDALHSADAGAASLASSRLTPREREVLELLVEGYPNSALSRILHISEKTVKLHLTRVYRKLDVTNRTQAGRWAQLHGLATGPAERRSRGDDVNGGPPVTARRHQPASAEETRSPSAARGASTNPDAAPPGPGSKPREPVLDRDVVDLPPARHAAKRGDEQVPAQTPEPGHAPRAANA